MRAEAARLRASAMPHHWRRPPRVRHTAKFSRCVHLPSPARGICWNAPARIWSLQRDIALCCEIYPSRRPASRLQDRLLAVLAVDLAEDVADLADGDAGPDRVHDRRHRVAAALGRGPQGIEGPLRDAL